MARASAGAANPYGRTGVRIVVAGDRGTGKSSLIVTAAAENFPANVPPVLPPTRLPEDFYPDRVPVTIIDTSSRVEDDGKVAEELKRADAVVLTYACDEPSTLDRLSSFWLPKLRKLEVKVPVIVVGCKLDLRDDNQQMSLEQVMSPIMQQFREIETCIECSAFKHIQIPEVFYYAQKAVLHPTGPLFDQETQTLKPRCVRALKRIFILCDHDRDGALSDAELNDFQVKCFNAPLQPSEIIGVKRVVAEKLPEGVNERGLTLTGFLFLHALFIEKGRLETTWTVLRKFGYNNDIKLADELLPSSFKRAPDQSVELTNEAIEYLKGIFDLFDNNQDGALRPREIEELFSTAAESPWEKAPYLDAAEKDAFGGLSLDGFLSEWSLMTLLDPSWSMENLIYIGYPGDPLSAFRVTRRRRLDRKKQLTDRNVFQCFVFGPNKAGKSALLNSFLGRPVSDNYNSSTEDRYAVNVVDQPGGIKKTLVLKEIPEDGVSKLLSIKNPWLLVTLQYLFMTGKRATELLVEVAGHGEDTGFEVPCPIVAAKDDLNSFPMAIQDSTRVNEEAGDEVLEIEQIYNEIRRPVYNTRNEIIKTIPDFWLTAFLSHPALCDLLNEEDQKIFKYLDSLDVEDFKDVKSGYSITFNFNENPYFEDPKLTKTFIFFGEGTTKITGTTIKWKEDTGASNGVNHEEKGNKRPRTDVSFFSWFTETEQKEFTELYDEVAEIIKEDLWPNPLKYFNNVTAYYHICSLSFSEADEEDSDGDEGDEEVSQDMGIEAPIPISAKLGDLNNVFRRIVNAAEQLAI